MHRSCNQIGSCTCKRIAFGSSLFLKWQKVIFRRKTQDAKTVSLGFKCNFTVNTISAKLCQLDCVISPILKRCYHILLPGLLPALSHSGRDPNLFQQSFLGFKQLNLHFHFVKVDIKLVSQHAFKVIKKKFLNRNGHQNNI